MSRRSRHPGAVFAFFAFFAFFVFFVFFAYFADKKEVIDSHEGWQMSGFRLGLALLLAIVLLGPVDSFAAVDLRPFLARGTFGAIKLSPTGEFYAATVRLPDRTALVVFRRKDNQPQAKVTGAVNSAIADFWWVNDQRVVVAMADQLGSLAAPQQTGELHGINADGSAARLLVGHTNAAVGSERVILGDFSAAYLIDDLPGDDRHVLIARSDYGSADPLTRVERMNVYNGKRKLIARAPVRRARFVSDPDGVVRFAVGAGNDNGNLMYYRADGTADWQLLNDENASGHAEAPLGFSADGATAYLQVEQSEGPDAVVAWDLASGRRKELLRDPRVDPFELIRDRAGAIVGVRWMDAGVRSSYFDADSADANAQRLLERSFKGASVRVTSSTSDGSHSIIRVSSDRDAGSYFFYAHESRKAQFIFGVSALVPEQLPLTRAVDVAARDGLHLRGYLTRPTDADGAGPLVLLVHGGPIGIFDRWEFDLDTQLLVAAGYSVLRVNYRGSGNYGRTFLQAGARQWGRAMQDDLTDATHWAIEQGYADAERICIVGSSYGAYAAMMGVARETGLYRCAVGYVGVYDLPLMVGQDARGARWFKNWTEHWVGAGDELAAISPVNLADRIDVPVLLVAGAEDQIAPIEHSERMQRALDAAKVPVETLYVEREGHGFYGDESRNAYYRRLLGFLAEHLGGSPAK